MEQAVRSSGGMLRQFFLVFIPDPDDVETLRRRPVGKIKRDHIETVSVEILAVSNHYGDTVSGKSERQIIETTVQPNDRISAEIQPVRRRKGESESANEGENSEVKRSYPHVK